MADELPPVVASILLQYEQFVQGTTAVEDRTKNLSSTLDGLLGSATDKASAGLDKTGASAEKTAGSLTTIKAETAGASAGLDRVGEAGTAASAGLDETAAGADRAAAALARTDVAGAGKGFEKVGEDAAGMGSKVGKAAKDTEKAEKDMESRSGGFSSKISSLFTHVGETMGNWGIPFSHSVTKMGEEIDKAETKGKGFQAAMVGIGKTATIVGGVALAGVAVESIKMADEFDVASRQLDNAIKDIGGSASALEPQIEQTYTSMAKLGFTNTETAKAMQLLVISTKDPVKAMADMGIAADLARAKNVSLESAVQSLAKVYAGSTRPLMQLGINLDVGSGKLKTIQTATESVTKAQKAYQTAQEEVAEATGTKVATADRKLEAAHEKLLQSSMKLRMDQEAIPKILETVQQRTQGAAKAFGETLAGQMKVAGAQINNLAVTLGAFLMPAIGAAASVLTRFINAIKAGSPVIVGIASVIGGVLVLAITSYITKLAIAAVVTAANFVKMATEGAVWVARMAGYFAVQVAGWLGLGTAAEAATVKTGAAAAAMATEVVAADAGIETANIAAGASFTAMLGPIAAVGAAIIALKGPAEQVWATITGHGGPEGLNAATELLAKNPQAAKIMQEAKGMHQLGSSSLGQALGSSGGGVESEILKTAMAHGLSPAAAAAMVGNAAQESSLSPTAGGGGLYQMSGYSAADSAGSAQQQTERAIQLMGSSVVALMNAAKTPAEAAVIMEKLWEKPAGSQPGETATTNNRPHREQAAEEAARKISGAISGTSPSATSKGIKHALEATQAAEAKKGIAEALATAKQHIAELKATFATAWGELAKTSEKIFKMMQAKGGIKTHELLGMERAHEAEEAKVARAEAEENVRKAQSGEGVKTAEKELEVARRKETEAVQKLTDAVNKLHTAERERQRGKGSKSTVESAKAGVESAEGSATSAKEATANAFVNVNTAKTSQTQEIKQAQQALNNILYQEKVANLKKEAKAEETAIAHANAAKQAAFTAALNQLKAHLAHGKTSTEQAMKEIEKVLRKFGVTFGAVGKDAGQQWVKQFEAAIKKAATDAGGLSAEISADIKAGIKIPHMAAGGIVTSPTLAMIGESGPEAVVPLTRGQALGDGVAPLPAAGKAGGGLQVGAINLYGQNATSAELVRELYYQLRPMLVTS